MDYINFTDTEIITTPVAPEDSSDNGISFLERFEVVYLNMDENKKWKLTTGKCVEDGLYEYGLICDSLNLCHLFIVDPDDENYILQGIFTKKELDEIKYPPERFFEFPQKVIARLGARLDAYLARYNRVESIADLRDVLKEDGDRFDDFDWVHRSIDNWRVMYENVWFSEQHNSNWWYYFRVWPQFLSVLEKVDGVYIKNSNDKRDSWTIMYNNIEIGHGEYNQREQETEKNCYSLCVESVSVMKKMLYELFSHVKFDLNAIRNLHIIGLTIDENNFRLDLLDSPEGYACRIEHDDSACSIPTVPQDIKGNSFNNFLVVLLLMKILVQDTVQLLTIPR